MGFGDLWCSSGYQTGPMALRHHHQWLVHSRRTIMKYVDDTTVSEIISKGQSSSVQEYVDSVADWSADNRFQLNIDRCKEIRISFSKNNADLPPLFINGQELEVVQNTKLLGVTITDNLSWNLHINETIKKASKRLYFLRQLKRARVSTSDSVRFYTCFISCTSLSFIPA